MSKDQRREERFNKYMSDEYDPIKAGSIDGKGTDPHDKAIIRAVNSKYRPNFKLKSDPKTTFFVGNLSPKTDEESLTKYFSHEIKTKIVSCVVVRDIVTQESKRYGFIEFEKKISEPYSLNATFLDNYKIIVQREVGRILKNWKPRRLGGGFGGNKNSGQLRFGGYARPFIDTTRERGGVPQ